jgi:serine/threonine protein kinase
MKRIAIRSVQTTGLDPAFRTIGSLEIEDVPIGQGGFGEVYSARSIDNRNTPPQVIKLLTDTGYGIAQRGFQTIQELQRRLTLKNAEMLQHSGRGLLDQIPALQGVPQFSFEGIMEGRQVMGYSANDLKAAGLDDFGRILDDDTKAQQFQAVPLAAKMRIAAQLINAFHFLSTHILFIHADVKAEALFIDTKRQRGAVIDFDSGALARDPNDKPTTFGTKQDWLAPEIVKQLDVPGNSARLIKVDLLSDIWSINVAIHYLLFGFHPLFFLTEISDRSIGAYFRGFQWPDCNASFQYFRQEYASIHRQYMHFLKTKLPQEIVQRLAFTINKGYLDPTSRTTYGQWKTILGAINRPAIKQFSANRTLITDTRPVRLSWDVTGAARLEIPGIGDVTGRVFVDVRVRRDTTFTLVLTPDQGAQLKNTIHVQVSKDPPKILSFSTSRDLLTDATPARLHWNVTGAERVEIDNNVGDVTGRSHVDVLPRRDSSFTLTAISPFGVVAKASVQVRVSTTPPSILCFQSDRDLLCDPRPVELIWKVSEDAHEVMIDGVGVVKKEGSIRIPQRRDTVYVLRARTFYGYSSESRVTVCVSKDPPQIESFVANPLFVREGMETEIRWRVIGASQVWIEPTIGVVFPEGQLNVRLGREAQFVICAESYFGVSVTSSLTVRLLKSTTLGVVHQGTALQKLATSIERCHFNPLDTRRITALRVAKNQLSVRLGGES